jgi:hypothetical protein
MYCVDYTRVGKTPELVPPFLGVAVLILGVIIIDEVRITDVFVERLVKWCISQEVGKLIAWRHGIVRPVDVFVDCFMSWADAIMPSASRDSDALHINVCGTITDVMTYGQLHWLRSSYEGMKRILHLLGFRHRSRTCLERRVPPEALLAVGNDLR